MRQRLVNLVFMARYCSQAVAAIAKRRAPGWRFISHTKTGT